MNKLALSMALILFTSSHFLASADASSNKDDKCYVSMDGGLILVDCEHPYYFSMWEGEESIVGFFGETNGDPRRHAILPGTTQFEVVPRTETSYKATITSIKQTNKQ